MIIYSFKSKSKKINSFVQPNKFPYEKRWILRINQLLAIVLAFVLLSSCQKENLNNPVFNNTTSEDLSASAATKNSIPAGLIKMTWTIEGVSREALVHPPEGGSGSAPVIFAFHGHSGTASGFSQKGFQKSWPEAIVVYPQGLPTVSGNDPKGNNPGWQHSVGEINIKNHIKDQDLKFFDAMLATLKQKYKVNSSQVFVHGWSNGGEFIYDVLWAARADKLAALSPSAASLNSTTGKKPLPAIHVAGTSDPYVSFSRQQQSVQSVRTLDKCSSTATTWATGANGLLGKKYSSSISAPVVSLQYNGGHGYPFTVPPLIVKFFKEVAGVPTN